MGWKDELLMATLSELTRVLRSKNAGPFLITIDLMFVDQQSYKRVFDSGRLTDTLVASLYRVERSEVHIIPFPELNTIKVTLPRWGASSGAPGDRDVYGAQFHAPLLKLEVP